MTKYISRYLPRAAFQILAFSDVISTFTHPRITQALDLDILLVSYVFLQTSSYQKRHYTSLLFINNRIKKIFYYGTKSLCLPSFETNPSQCLLQSESENSPIYHLKPFLKLFCCTNTPASCCLVFKENTSNETGEQYHHKQDLAM